jgi:WD40 repeat protein
LTDGDTHSGPVSVILYNELFQLIVTCGLDSFIISWDPWNGNRKNLIKNAHTNMVHGEKINIQITAGCFDPKYQLLLTGARDGTLKVMIDLVLWQKIKSKTHLTFSKIWNFNDGFCVRNLMIEYMCEVTAVFWVPDRIFAVGWNRHVTEFADRVDETDFGIGKSWDTCHTDEILCAATRLPQILATGSRNGELILWNFETGQPYRKYHVADPQTVSKV